MARYRIGADACSSSQVTGKVSGSGAGAAIIVGGNSAAVPGAVTSSAQHVEGTGLRSRQSHEPPTARGRIADFRAGARGWGLSACAVYG
jgi:hypothetical protein